jgi:putative DNA primase/helicase
MSSLTLVEAVESLPLVAVMEPIPASAIHTTDVTQIETLSPSPSLSVTPDIETFDVVGAVNPIRLGLSAVRADMVTTVPSQSVHVYPKSALAMLLLKCPTIRNYVAEKSPLTIGAELLSGLNRTLAPFEQGPERARQAGRGASEFDQAQFDSDMTAGRLPGAACYTCAQARLDGSTKCPSNGCVTPDGEIADAPIDLLLWDCNINEIGQGVIATSIITSEFGTELVSVTEKFLAYSDGFFHEVDDKDLLRRIIPHVGPMAVVRRAKEIAELLRISHVRQIDQISPSPDLICFSNGTLNVTTQRMEPHNPAHGERQSS